MGHTNFFTVTDEAKYQELFSMLCGGTSDGPTAVQDLSNYDRGGRHAFAWRGLLYTPVTEDVCRICPDHEACPFADNKPIFSKTETKQADARDECGVWMRDQNETNMPVWYDALQTILPDDEAAIFVEDDCVEDDCADIVTRQVRKTIFLNAIVRDEAVRLLGVTDYRLIMGWEMD